MGGYHRRRLLAPLFCVGAGSYVFAEGMDPVLQHVHDLAGEWLRDGRTRGAEGRPPAGASAPTKTNTHFMYFFIKRLPVGAQLVPAPHPKIYARPFFRTCVSCNFF